MSNYLLFLMMLWVAQAIALLVSPGLSHVTVFTKPLQTNCIFQEFYNIFFFLVFIVYVTCPAYIYDQWNCYFHLWWEYKISFFKNAGASLVAQWLRVCLRMQGTRVRALVWEDPTCRGAAGPVSHNY